ncbi:MAG: putative lipid II flippase FtsW [bacterium]|nr:putative lipid II flippase FtsW [bacterium]
MNRHVDYTFLTIILILFVVGVFVMSSASTVISDKNFGTFYGYTFRHIIYGAIGLGALFFASRVPYKVWKKMALPVMGLSLLLLALVFFPPIGFSHGGASRWLNFGFFTFQPSEAIKISFILYLASWLAKKRDEDKGIMNGLLPFSVMLGIVSIFLIMQPDIGTLIVIALTAIVLYFLGGGRLMQIATLVFLGLVGIFVLARLAPYRMQRFMVFLDPGSDPLGMGYHINQALIAIGSGGFWGRGFGQSLQKYNYLPEPIGDSIFAIVGEEFGFLGVTILSALFLLFLWRAISIARKAPDMFSKLAVSGIASSIAFQAFINMAAISGLLPLTGIPLPFISYGGTALVATLFGAGIILNVSRYT